MSLCFPLLGVRFEPTDTDFFMSLGLLATLMVRETLWCTLLGLLEVWEGTRAGRGRGRENGSGGSGVAGNPGSPRGRAE